MERSYLRTLSHFFNIDMGICAIGAWSKEFLKTLLLSMEPYSVHPELVHTACARVRLGMFE